MQKEAFEAVIRICREKMQKAKAQLELKLASVDLDSKKVFLSMLIARGGLEKTLDCYLLKVII